jgi:hypothetical protein
VNSTGALPPALSGVFPHHGEAIRRPEALIGANDTGRTTRGERSLIRKASTSRHESIGQPDTVNRPRDPAAFAVRTQVRKEIGKRSSSAAICGGGSLVLDR